MFLEIYLLIEIILRIFLYDDDDDDDDYVHNGWLLINNLIKLKNIRTSFICSGSKIKEKRLNNLLTFSV